MEKVNVIVKAKLMQMAEGVADALIESGKVNIVYVNTGDVNKTDWESAQLSSSVVIYSNVKIAYEPETDMDNPYGTYQLNFPQIDMIINEINKYDDSDEIKNQMLRIFIHDMVKEDISCIVTKLYTLPRKGYAPTLADLLQ